MFGSYAKGYAKDTSDVDLCVSTELGGLDFAGLSESIRNTLNKRVDLIRFNNLSNNFDLINEIMKDGVKIYWLKIVPVVISGLIKSLIIDYL